MEDYAELLKHPSWQRKRLEILQRDDFTCLACEDKETTLHVHHREYIKGKKPWEYPDKNFKTLCEECHENLSFNKTGPYKRYYTKIPKYIPKALLSYLEHEKHFPELLAMYLVYTSIAKWQKTNQPKATTGCMALKMGWGVDKTIQRKRKLVELGLIEDINRRKDDRIIGWYVEVNFITSKKDIEKLNKKL